MYEVTIMLDGYIDGSQNCETLEEAVSLLGKCMQEDLEVLSSSSPRDIEKVTFNIEKKETIFSVTF